MKGKLLLVQLHVSGVKSDTGLHQPGSKSSLARPSLLTSPIWLLLAIHFAFFPLLRPCNKVFSRDSDTAAPHLSSQQIFSMATDENNTNFNHFRAGLPMPVLGLGTMASNVQPLGC